MSQRVCHLMLVREMKGCRSRLGRRHSLVWEVGVIKAVVAVNEFSRIPVNQWYEINVTETIEMKQN
jgi:hypothetical protein